MSSSESTAANVKLVGGRLCLDFANTVGGRSPAGSGSVVREDKLNEYRDLAVWSSHAGSISEREARKLIQESLKKPLKAQQVLNRAIQLREAIYGILESVMQNKNPSAEDLNTLNRELQIARDHEILTGKAGPYVWQWQATRTELDRLLWPITISAADLLTTGDLSRIRRCGGEDCGWIFEDTSKNRSRQWCVMSDCGNLAKVRRFRSKAR